MKRPDDLQAVIERARQAVRKTKPEQTRSAGLHYVADVLLGVAHEVRAAFDEQRQGIVNWRLSFEDVERISSVAQWAKYAAHEWDWQQNPEISQAQRANRPVEERVPNSDEWRAVEGMPARPCKPKCQRRDVNELPVGFPKMSSSWSDMATDFLQTRRGARGSVDDVRGVD